MHSHKLCFTINYDQSTLFQCMAWYRYKIVPPQDILSTGFLQPNGSWTGTTGQLQRKVCVVSCLTDAVVLKLPINHMYHNFHLFQEVDMCVTMSVAVPSKTNILDISYPVVYADSAILIPFPKENSRVQFDKSSFEFPVQAMTFKACNGAFKLILIQCFPGLDCHRRYFRCYRFGYMDYLPR